ncbi:MAG: ADP-ribosylglycohydrolase family protein [Actinomycetaceae bacterium]|nr:ADP-ribosylglycohydrolase family protein [Actinomycetaceae bacterium]
MEMSRALGALWGLAIGDALGMPTQDMHPDLIRADYGVVDRLIPAGPNQRIAAGAPAGMITDDTEQALILARLLAQDGFVDPLRLSVEMLAWEDDMRARGSLDLLGPSTRGALARIRDGVAPSEAGQQGTTNGAAMRVAPVALTVPAQPLDNLVDAVVVASEITHGTSVALAGAAAVAAVVAAGIDGADKNAAIAYGIEAAQLAGGRGHQAPRPDIATRARWAIPMLATADNKIDALFHIIGTSMESHESVVAALAITALDISDWDAVCLAANAGGDTDTVAAMVGAMRGAMSGVDTWPQDVVALISETNSLDLTDIAQELVARKSQ